MATNGQLNTNTTYDSYFWVKWSQNGSQDIANNRTSINWSCGVYCGHSFFSNAIKMSAVTIDGTQVYGGGTYSNYSKGDHTIASGTMWINHTADGSKNFIISSFTGWLYSGHNYSSNGGSFTLNTIARASQPSCITWPNNQRDVGKFGDTITIHMNRMSDKFTHNVYYSFYSLSWQWIASNVTNNTEWHIPLDLIKELTSDSGWGTIYVETYTDNGTKLVGTKSCEFSAIVPDNDETRPSVGMNISLNNGLLPDKFNGIYIQGKSKLDVSLSADGKYGANITNLYAVIDGKTYTKSPFTSDVIRSSGNVVAYAKDSRGLTGSNSQPIEVVPYSKPLVENTRNENAILCYRSDGNGNRVGNSTSVWVKAKRSYYSISGRNQCALQWRKKTITEEWSDPVHQWHDLIAKSNTTTDEYNALISGVFDQKKSYTVQIRAMDDIGEYDVKTLEIPTQDVALHLGKGGKNVSIGTYCDCSKEHTFYSDWDAYFDKDVYIGNEKVADFIVEQGTSGIWTYRKWNSGIAECWGNTKEENHSITNHYGSGLYVNTHVRVDFPQNLFVNTPSVTADFFTQRQSYGCAYATVREIWSAAFEIAVIDTWSTERPGFFCIQAKGRWK